MYQSWSSISAMTSLTEGRCWGSGTTRGFSFSLGDEGFTGIWSRAASFNIEMGSSLSGVAERSLDTWEDIRWKRKERDVRWRPLINCLCETIIPFLNELFCGSRSQSCWSCEQAWRKKWDPENPEESNAYLGIAIFFPWEGSTKSNTNTWSSPS